MAGHIITLIGGKGGVGKSQVAANLAYAYAAESRSKVLLMDFDQKASGDQNYITGLNSKKTIKELGDFPGAIDPRSIMSFVTTDTAGVSFIGMPNDPVVSEQINSEGLGKSLKAIPNIYPTTIIDAGSELNAVASKALEFTTAIFIVVVPDILALNQTKKLYSDLITMMFPKEMIFFVANQYQKGHPISTEVMQKALGRPIFSIIPRDDQSCISALNKKRAVFKLNKNAVFSKGLTELSRKIIQKGMLKNLEKLKKSVDTSARGNSEDKAVASNKAAGWKDLKDRIHRALVEEMDFKKQDDNDPKAQVILKEQTKKTVVDLLNKEDTKGIINNRDDMNNIVKEIIDEALGLGPLEDLLANKECSEIMVVGPDKIYYELSGKIKKSTITFTNDRQVLNVIERIVAPIGRRIDEKTPYVDARLADGSRVHAIIPPCALDGSTITIRKFPENRLTYKDLVKFDSLTQNMADFLRIAVEAHRNIIVSGGTGSGKTTLINILGGFIQANERIITCEDSAELNFPQDHVVRLETRPPSLEGDGEIDIRLLVKQTLRMRPDRIVVGECRGGETLDMLQAMGTGHDGSMTTIHSNNPRECIGRVETLVQYAGAGLSPKAIREMIAAAVHLIVQQSRLDDGSRKITHITELGGMQGDVVVLQDIFLFQQKGINKAGKIDGEFQATGFIPKFIETLEKKGYNVPRGLFTNADPRTAKAPAPSPGNKPAQPPGKKPPPNQNRPGQPQKKRKA